MVYFAQKYHFFQLIKEQAALLPYVAPFNQAAFRWAAFKSIAQMATKMNMMATQSKISRHKTLLRLCARIGYSPPQNLIFKNF